MADEPKKLPVIKDAIDRTLWQFTVGEFEKIHEQMDLCSVPRFLDGSKLSAAQRVAYYIIAREEYAAAFSKARGHAPH